MENSWKIIDSYFNEKGLVKIQIESYDYFLETVLQKIVHDYGSFTIGDLSVSCKSVYITPPQVIETNTGEIRNLLPNEARMRSLTYSAPVFMDMEKNGVPNDEIIITKPNPNLSRVPQVN